MKPPRFYFAAGLILTTTVVFSQQLKCADFKTGTFKLLDANAPNYFITRNDTLQTETAEKSIISTDFYIRWDDECHYELTLKKIYHRPAGLKMPDKTIRLFVHIYKVSGDTCWVETRAGTTKYVSKKRMVKIR
ncbi:MAG: hypothetical protein DRJ09_00475 [Bacteroidetes bacterium]|nr:MAG: hypothetical protein DRJ09_00475 [Bacteroidota bacterium]